MTIHLAISGALGRMGQMIADVAAADPDVEVVAGIDRTPRTGGAFPVVTSPAQALGAGAEVIIDFSLPEGTLGCVEACRGKGVGLVVGTTGFSPQQLEALASAAREVPLLRAPNMSVGVNVLYKLLADAARLLGPSFDISIVEGHHRHKLDRPSGTALRMADVLEGATGGRRPEIAVFRGGEVVGEHTALFLGTSERIEITHRAASRRVFAEGAVRAAKWLAHRPPGAYDMKDVLG